MEQLSATVFAPGDNHPAGFVGNITGGTHLTSDLSKFVLGILLPTRITLIRDETSASGPLFPGTGIVRAGADGLISRFAE